jgi:c(7)-type cytochrome triheme protein
MIRKALVWGYVLSFSLALPFSAVAENVGGGDLTYTPKGAKPVVFSHEIHVNVKGLKCSNCHYHMFQMSPESYAMDMSKLTKGEFCGKCHNGQKSFDLKDANNCSKCHK